AFFDRIMVRSRIQSATLISQTMKSAIGKAPCTTSNDVAEASSTSTFSFPSSDNERWARLSIGRALARSNSGTSGAASGSTRRTRQIPALESQSSSPASSVEACTCSTFFADLYDATSAGLSSCSHRQSLSDVHVDGSQITVTLKHQSFTVTSV